jgi:hypothetical protein
MSSTHYSCQILIPIEFSGQILGKYSNTKFHENPISGSRVVSCGRRQTYGQANKTKLTVAFPTSVNGPKNSSSAII